MQRTYRVIILTLISFNCYAQCSHFELKGHVRTVKNELHLVVAEKTLSEKDLLIKMEVTPKLAPYTDRFISGVFILKNKDLVSGNLIVAAKNIDDAVYDPMKQNAENSWKKLKDASCPKD